MQRLGQAFDMANLPDKASLKRLTSTIVPRVKARHVIDHLYSTGIIIEAEYDDLVENEPLQNSSNQMRHVLRLVRDSLREDAVLRLSEALHAAGHVEIATLLEQDHKPLNEKPAEHSTAGHDTRQQTQMAAVGSSVNPGQCSINIHIQESEAVKVNREAKSSSDDAVDGELVYAATMNMHEQKTPNHLSSTKHSSNTVSTRSLVEDFVRYKLRKAGYESVEKNGECSITPPSKIHQCLRDMGDQFSSQYYECFGDMTSNVQIGSPDLRSVLIQVLDINFESAVTWGRLCGAMSFAANLAIHARSLNRLKTVEDIVEWTVEYLERYKLSNWISLHGGWVSS